MSTRQSVLRTAFRDSISFAKARKSTFLLLALVFFVSLLIGWMFGALISWPLSTVPAVLVLSVVGLLLWIVAAKLCFEKISDPTVTLAPILRISLTIFPKTVATIGVLLLHLLPYLILGILWYAAVFLVSGNENEVPDLFYALSYVFPIIAAVSAVIGMLTLRSTFLAPFITVLNPGIYGKEARLESIKIYRSDKGSMFLLFLLVIAVSFIAEGLSGIPVIGFLVGLLYCFIQAFGILWIGHFVLNSIQAQSSASSRSESIQDSEE